MRTIQKKHLGSPSAYQLATILTSLPGPTNHFAGCSGPSVKTYYVFRSRARLLLQLATGHRQPLRSAAPTLPFTWSTSCSVIPHQADSFQAPGQGRVDRQSRVGQLLATAHGLICGVNRASSRQTVSQPPVAGRDPDPQSAAAYFQHISSASCPRDSGIETCDAANYPWLAVLTDRTRWIEPAVRHS